MLEILQAAPTNVGLERNFYDKKLDSKSEKLRKMLCQALNYFYYPSKSHLVINALLTGLHDLEQNLVVRATFDFLISHIKINGDFLLE